MLVFQDINSLRLKLKEYKNKKIGFVPTMGALHQGHLSLVSEAKKEADIVVVSIFVNPMQFNDVKDLKNYPRDNFKDKKLLEEEGVDILFLPESDEILSGLSEMEIELPDFCDRLCGEKRPGHFLGVAKIVKRLFEIVEPDFAYFGAKDYQQYALINDLTIRYHLMVKVGKMPIIREKSGLAMSSRNENLETSDRENIAPKLYQELVFLRDQINKKSNILEELKKAKERLIAAGFSKIDYLEILNSDLSDYKGEDKNARIFVAAFLNGTRLIDNLCLNAKEY